jgi:Fur family ferric uptake transcriptional regulator
MSGSSGASASGVRVPGTRRRTAQHEAVLHELAGSDVFVTAQEVHGRLRAGGSGIGLATVYRALAALAADGELDVRRTEEGETAYRRCSQGHHHHLVCRTCGRTVELDGPAVESWADRVSAQHSFRDTRHTVELVGTCADC